MGRWGRCDYRELKKLDERLQQLSEVDMDRLCRDAAKKIEKHGEQYTVTIINNLEYASYVEYGHRQTPGRYVPALGKTLKASWVKGRFMLTISEQEVKTLAPSILNDMLYDALKGVFS